jgi:hypothetical protein
MVLTRQELIASLQNEVRILVHLCGKVEPAMLDYRPTPKQRSTIELLRYLAVMGPALVPCIKAGAFLEAEWKAAAARVETLDFPALVQDLAAQSGFYAQALGAFSDDDFRAEIDLFGMKGKRGPMLVNLIIAGHAAYRTQLFLYLKSCGREELNTMNLWAGMDAPAA